MGIFCTSCPLFSGITVAWDWFSSVLNDLWCSSCSCNHAESPIACPYPWLPLQRLLLEMILLVFMADPSQSLTWVMAMLTTVLSSAVLPWWQKERVPACQRKGSAESWRVTESLTSLSVWLTATPFIDMETLALGHNDRLAVIEAIDYHVFVELLSLSCPSPAFLSHP